MALFELVVGVLFIGGILSLWANRTSLPYPALLALVGAGLALVPGAPTLRLDPELALTLFVAPTLLDAAYDASARDLRANLVPVASLAVGMVLATIVTVACAVRLVFPEMAGGRPSPSAASSRHRRPPRRARS